jgi:hypothetical protein
MNSNISSLDLSKLKISQTVFYYNSCDLNSVFLFSPEKNGNNVKPKKSRCLNCGAMKVTDNDCDYCGT